MRDGTLKSTLIDAPDNKAVKITIAIDLKAQKIALTANGEKIETQIQPPVKAITHLGYAIESAHADFAPIQAEVR